MCSETVVSFGQFLYRDEVWKLFTLQISFLDWLVFSLKLSLFLFTLDFRLVFNLPWEPFTSFLCSLMICSMGHGHWFRGHHTVTYVDVLKKKDAGRRSTRDWRGRWWAVCLIVVVQATLKSKISALTYWRVQWTLSLFFSSYMFCSSTVVCCSVASHFLVPLPGLVASVPALTERHVWQCCHLLLAVWLVVCSTSLLNDLIRRLMSGWIKWFLICWNMLQPSLVSPTILCDAACFGSVINKQTACVWVQLAAGGGEGRHTVAGFTLHSNTEVRTHCLVSVCTSLKR